MNAKPTVPDVPGGRPSRALALLTAALPNTTVPVAAEGPKLPPYTGD